MSAGALAVLAFDPPWRDDPLAILGVIAFCVALSEWLVRHTPLRHLGPALLVIVVTAVAANLGAVPTGTGPVPLYDGIFGFVAPLAIFWLLLGVRLRGIVEAGGALLFAFLLGTVGTAIGVVLAASLVGGAEAFGPSAHAVAGMFAGTYTGGSLNFNAIALQYDVAREGAVYTGAVAADNVMTTLWMLATLLLPRFLGRFARMSRPESNGVPAARAADAGDEEHVHPRDLALMLGLGAAAVWVAAALERGSAAQLGFEVPRMISLTAIALACAQVPAVARLRGARLLGMTAVMFFLAVIGAYCDLAEFERIGRLGITMLWFAGITVLVHGVFAFGGAALFRIDRNVAAIASQANVGGGTTALALARSLGRPDLVLPAILVGSLGTGIGTFVGFGVVAFLGG